MMYKVLLATTVVGAVAAMAGGSASANNEVLKMSQNPKDWVMPTGDYANQRYSKLKQITADNVGKLQVAWTFSTGVLRGHEGGPLVIGDMMYVHTPFPNTVYALDLNDDGKIIWKYEPKQDPNVIPVMCCDTVNRGVAYADGKIFLHQADTTLVALDAKTGKVVWTVGERRSDQGRDQHLGAAGGQGQGARRHLGRRVRRARPRDRLQHQDGKQVWRAFSTGPDEQIADRSGEDHRTRQAGRQGFQRSRPGKATSGRSAAARTWGWYSYDPELEPDLLRLRQPLDLEPAAAPRRQQVVDDDLRPRSRHRHGEVGLSDDAARRVGL